MIAKTLSFGSPGRLTVKNLQLVYDGEDGVHRTFPIEDLGFVIIETGLMTISSSCIMQLAENNVALVVCDKSHTPSAQMLPFSAHTTAHETVMSQIAATDAVNGRLWRQIVKAKIRNQAVLLKKLNHESQSRRLFNMAEEVKNRDVGNLEAQAARIYFHPRSSSFGSRHRSLQIKQSPDSLLFFVWTRTEREFLLPLRA